MPKAALASVPVRQTPRARFPPFAIVPVTLGAFGRPTCWPRLRATPQRGDRPDHVRACAARRGNFASKDSRAKTRVARPRSGHRSRPVDTMYATFRVIGHPRQVVSANWAKSFAYWRRARAARKSGPRGSSALASRGSRLLFKARGGCRKGANIQMLCLHCWWQTQMHHRSAHVGRLSTRRNIHV